MSDKITLRNRIVKDLDLISRLVNLWIIDLSNNMIECVSGLSRFVVLGHLNVSNNRLTWRSLEPVRDLYVVYAEFHGNAVLESDPHYRQQIIDIFPRLFCLDGKFVNAIERNETNIFFEKSNFCKVPIRRRLRKESFRPTSSKSLRLYGKFGQKAFEFLTQFPNTIPLNEEWDKRKITYIAHFVTSNIISNRDEFRWVVKWIEQLIYKTEDVQSISDLYVILVLFMGNMEFGLDSSLCEKALERNEIHLISVNDLVSFFHLKIDEKVWLMSVFLAILSISNTKNQIKSACVVELYLSMQNLLWVQIRSDFGSNFEELILKYRSKKLHSNYRLSRSLIAAESFMILSKVESILENLEDDALNKIIDHATGQENFLEYVKSEFDDEKVDPDRLISLILADIQRNVEFIFGSPDILFLEMTPYLNASRRMSAKSARRMIDISDNLSRGQSSYRKSCEIYKETEKKMDIGDLVLLSSQIVAHVLAVPERNSVIVQIRRSQKDYRKGSSQSSETQNIEQINPNLFEWNHENEIWIPCKSTGDGTFLSKTKPIPKQNEDTNANSIKRPVIDVSKITICDESASINPDDEDEITLNVSTISEVPNQDYQNYIRDISFSSQASPRHREFRSPTCVKHDFSEINSCLRFDSVTKPRLHSVTPSPRYSYSNQVSFMFSTGPPVINNARLWLGNGENVYRRVRWNSKNPQNMMKRLHVPGWINRDPNYYQQQFSRK